MKKHNARKKKIAAKKAKQATQMQKNSNRGLSIPCPEGVISLDFPEIGAVMQLPGSLQTMNILTDTLQNMVFDGPQRGAKEVSMLGMALYEKGLNPVIKIGNRTTFFKDGKLVIC